ncbi:C40 family peptidase [Ureibacillus sp. FSL K6-2830]|uniref:C40 family peptidase n=1 Tax=Ureibacillus sp. FSL K6-2830 TaxID=2954610 RepID=UPI0030F82C1A
MYRRKKSIVLISAGLLASCIFAQSVYASTESDKISGKKTLEHFNIKSNVLPNNFSNIDRSKTRKETLSKARMTKLNIPDRQLASQITYKVVKGDTLTKISKKFNVTVEDMMNWNQLSSADVIYAGQILTIYSSSQSPNHEEQGDLPNQNIENEVKNPPHDELLVDEVIKKQLEKEQMIDKDPSEKGRAIYNKVLEIANAQLGVPYLFGGNTPEGFDCSGFVRYVFANAGLDIQRKSSEDYFNQDTTVVKNPVPGDVIFFKNTYKTGISHMGIYLGDGKFIHAGDNGVEVSNVHYDYWNKHFVTYKRFKGIN